MSREIEQAQRVLRIEADAIAALIPRLGESFQKAIEICLACKGRMVVCGMGKSGNVAQKIAATLASTGTSAFFLHPAEGLHGDLGMVSRNDAMIAISNSGETDELVRLLPPIKRLGLPVIALCGNSRSTLAKNADVFLDISVKEEACPMGLTPTASTTAALAMGDTLAIVLMQRRGFNQEDFATFHPGGSLGKRLLLRVDEVMHTGSEIPVVHPSTPMKETFLVMSEKKLGMTTVQEEGRLVGVITDGDLRRLIEEHAERLFTMRAVEVMTRNPKVIAEGVLAAKAVEQMESHSITSLVVVGGGGSVRGVIHLHDLLKAGVV